MNKKYQFLEEQRVLEIITRLFSSKDDKTLGTVYRLYLSLPPHLQKKFLRQVFSMSVLPQANHESTLIFYLEYPEVLCRTIKYLSFDETKNLAKFFARNKNVFLKRKIHVPETCEEAIFIAGLDAFDDYDLFDLFENVARVFRKILDRDSGKSMQEFLSRISRALILHKPYHLANHLPGDYSKEIVEFGSNLKELEKSTSATGRLEKSKNLFEIYEKIGSPDLKFVFSLALNTVNGFRV